MVDTTVLRKRAGMLEYQGYKTSGDLLNQAADELDSLRSAIRKQAIPWRKGPALCGEMPQETVGDQRVVAEIGRTAGKLIYAAGRILETRLDGTVFVNEESKYLAIKIRRFFLMTDFLATLATLPADVPGEVNL